MFEHDLKSQTETDFIPAGDIFPEELFVIPLRSRPIFPGVLTPLIISQGKFSQIVDRNVNVNSYVALLLMREEDMEDIRKLDLFSHGTMARVLKKINLPDGGINLLINCFRRIKVKKFLSDAPKIRAEIQYLEDKIDRKDIEVKALTRAIMGQLKVLSENNPLFSEEMKLTMVNVEEPGRISDFVASILNLEKKDYQHLMETADVKVRLGMVHKFLEKEIRIAEVQQRIQSQINDKIESQQKDFFLNEQLKVIRRELGLDDKDRRNDVRKLRAKFEEIKLPPDAREKVNEELDKFEYLEPQAGEYAVVRNYLETILALPWNEYSPDNQNIDNAEEILNRDHFGLTDVKKRILEFLSVRILKKDASGSIICLVGPPGVGKTSLGKAMASAIGRKFFRISLGGIKDEAEIKGHRRTYIGAMPGKIMQGLKICKTKNPVFMLDEIDKMGVSFQGDPASSLLEVLDPEQNNNFRDHYVDINFDISRVLFITTANTLDSIPPVLLDRMEIIRIPGYLDSEKKEILRKFLLPKQLKKHGLEPSDLKIQQKTALEIIDKYAREAGLRQLERAIEKICRRRAFEKVKKIAFQTEIKTEDLADLLGPVRFSEENIKKAMDPGIVTGLAWTEFGGAILTIEAIGLKGKAGLKLTGHLGEVMKESANIAYSYARRLGTMQEQIGQFLKSHEIHLHIPAGATPKDGPSAGITMALAMVSLASATAVSNTISMTGELTLSGNILPIGGLKEKALAAHRNKIKKVLFPAENIKDLKEIPDYLKKGIKFIPVEKLDEVIDICLPKLIKRK